MEFNKLPLSAPLLQAVEKLGYKSCTPVQEQLIPPVIAGQDCIVQAKTGSGKTAAFGLGLLHNLVWEKQLPQVLIIAPTRELALQIQEELDALGLYLKLKSVLLLGRQPYKRQIEQLKSKSHIVIGTPGRIKDHIDRGSLKLDEIQSVVLDEADQMLNMGFIDLVRSILSLLPCAHQSILCSATMPDEIQNIAHDFLHDPTIIQIENEDTEQIEQEVFFIEASRKIELLTRLLASEQVKSAMIFATTHEETDRIYETLSKLSISCEKLHGGMMQNERLAVMNGFKKGAFRYLIATDVAARGIDVPLLSMVVNLHIPRSQETYVHRIGRSGRMHERGRAVLLATNNERSYVSELFAKIDQPYKIGDSKQLMDTVITDETLEFITTAPDQRITKQEKMRADVMKIHLNGGKNKKIRIGDIVGAICQIEGITNDDIGVIEVKEHGSTVDILHGKGEQILKQLQNVTIKGKKLRIEKAKD